MFSVRPRTKQADSDAAVFDRGIVGGILIGSAFTALGAAFVGAAL